MPNPQKIHLEPAALKVGLQQQPEEPAGLGERPSPFDHEVGLMDVLRLLQ